VDGGLNVRSTDACSSSIVGEEALRKVAGRVTLVHPDGDKQVSQGV